MSHGAVKTYLFAALCAVSAACGGTTRAASPADGGCAVIIPCPYPGFDVDTCTCRKADAEPGATLDASYADVVAGGLVLTGCPVGPNTSSFDVDMTHGGVPPTGSCDPGSTCSPTTTQRCAGGYRGASFQWSCTCSAGNWVCSLTGQSMSRCPPVVECDGSICRPLEYCSNIGTCCPMGALCGTFIDAGSD